MHPIAGISRNKFPRSRGCRYPLKIVFAAVLLLSTRPWSPAAASVLFRNRAYHPGPELSAPCTDDFARPQGEELMFRWYPSLPEPIRLYVFKLYRGYRTATADLVLWEELPAQARFFSFPARELSSGQVYTWELTGIFFDGTKTETSFCSFQIKE